MQHTTSENISLYPSDWNCGFCNDFAESQWENRTELEIERDTEQGVSFENYKNWVVETYEDSLS